THGLFSVSDTGTLVYRRGATSQTAPTWFDLEGRPEGSLGTPSEYANPTISPDGTRVAVAVGGAVSRDIWILDVRRRTSTRFTFVRVPDDSGVGPREGKNFFFSRSRAGPGVLFVKPADGSGEERLLFKSDEAKSPTSWSRDGRFLLFTSVNANT